MGEQEMVVEVPEVHHYKVNKHVPAYMEREVEMRVEVPERHIKEEIQVVLEPVIEYDHVPVNQVTLYESEKAKIITCEETDDKTIDVPCPVQCDRRIVRPVVTVNPNVVEVP